MGLKTPSPMTPFVAGEQLTIADISVVCDLSQFLRERLMADRLAATGFTPVSEGLEAAYPRATQHLRQLTARPAFAPYLEHSLERAALARQQCVKQAAQQCLPRMHPDGGPHRYRG